MMYYEDDIFNPNNVNYENDIDNKNIMNNILFDIKQMDKGYHKTEQFFNKVWKDGKFYKNISVEMYTSGDVGTKIRNAVTGQRYDYKVGSRSEDLLFKVKNVSGKLAKDSRHLFYDNPEQYENHQYVTVSSNIKEKWYNKNIKAIQ